MQRPLPNERWAKTIPRQAYEGSSEDLWNIQFSLNLENCSVDVMNVALKHLTTYDSTLPVQLELENCGGITLRRVLPCIPILTTSILAADKSIQLRKVLVERLSNQDAVDALCRWAIFCLFTPAQSFPHKAASKYVVSYDTIAQTSRVLSILLPLNAALRRIFLSSTAFVDFVTHVWMDKLERSDELFIDLDNEFMESCPVLWLLKTCLADEEGRRALLDRFEANGRIHELPSSFIHRAQQLGVVQDTRAQQLGLAVNAPGTVHHRTADYLFDLLDTLHKALNTHFPALRQRFLAAHYMGELLKALDATFTLVETTQEGVPRQYLKPLCSLLVHAAEQSTRGVLYWRDLVASGLIPLLGRMLIPLTPSETQPRTVGTHLVETLSLFTIYPAVLKSIRSTNSSALSQNIKGSDALCDVWESLRYRCWDTSRIFRATEGMSAMCDNVQCTRSTESDFIPKQCSGCSSVVYCSADCQRTDWVQFHRRECCHAREDYYNRKSTGALYSHSMRKFHAKWIEAEFNEPLNSSTVREMAQDHRGHAAHETLSIFLYIAAEQDMNVITLRDKTWWTAKAHWPFTQDFLEPRISAIMDQYKLGAFTEDVRMVEGVFHFAKEKMVYLTVVLKKKGKKYESIWSLAKHADCVKNV